MKSGMREEVRGERRMGRRGGRGIQGVRRKRKEGGKKEIDREIRKGREESRGNSGQAGRKLVGMDG